MEQEYIKIKDLIVGDQYYCDARNFKVGTWDGEKFCYIRQKFGHVYEDKELHWDTDPRYGTVKPLKIVEK